METGLATLALVFAYATKQYALVAKKSFASAMADLEKPLKAKAGPATPS